MRKIGRQGAGDPGTAGTGYVNRLRCGMRDAAGERFGRAEQLGMAWRSASMNADEESSRVAAAITLLTAFGDPFQRPRQSKGVPILPAGVEATAAEAFRELQENCSAYALKRDPEIELDPTLVIQVSKRNAIVRPGEAFPLWLLSTCDVDPQEVGGDQEMDKIVVQKLYSLKAVQTGPSWYDRLLMTARRLAATTPAQRKRLLYTQRREFHRDYILPFGVALGRYYFTCKTLGEVRKALRKLPLLRGAASLTRALLRWMSSRI
jgi:hypothetical protein